jgi:membrane protease YdiL (CAAX protease family)
MAGDTNRIIPLWRDTRFWIALLMGPLVCALMALWVPRGSVDYVVQWRLLLWLVLLYPVLEEMVFRGGLQTLLLRTQKGQMARYDISLANLMTSLLFALVHLLNHSPLWAVAIFVPSLLFGWFRERYNSVIPSMILHSGYNLSYFTTFGLPG